jgi:hypothetical protein
LGAIGSGIARLGVRKLMRARGRARPARALMSGRLYRGDDYGLVESYDELVENRPGVAPDGEVSTLARSRQASPRRLGLSTRQRRLGG